MKDLKYINKYLYHYKSYLIWGTIFVIVANIFQILPAQIVRHSFDLVGNTIGIYPLFKGAKAQANLYEIFTDVVLIYGTVIVVMALVRGVFLFWMRQTIIVMSRLIEYDLKNEIYAHYQTLPLSFYRRNNTGDLMARISEDVGHVRMYLGPAIMYGLNAVGSFVLVLAYMLIVNPTLTFYAMLPLPILSVTIYYVNNLIHKRSTEIQQKLSQMSTYVQESFSGIRVLKAFVREKDFADDFADTSNEYKTKALNLAMVNALFMPVVFGLIALSTVLTVYIGGLEVIDGTITLGNIAEFTLYIGMLVWPVTSLGWITSMTERADASQKRINEFLFIKTTLTSTKNIEKALVGDVVFKNVSLTYPDSGILALRNVSFSVKHGESLAILGATGSGKSTIASLICRLYDASEGEIWIDGLDIKDYKINSLRGQIGYVPQDVFLFSDSIRSNITFGAAKVSDDSIIQAAKDADVYDNIMEFPKGFDTELGERGITLSGGQKQRVSIARAISRNPSIIILDDALSAVDTKTENAILNNLQRIMLGKTSIIISHRVSSAKLADKIVFLNDGEVIEAGSHEELMALGDSYKELYEKQTQSEEEIV